MKFYLVGIKGTGMSALALGLDSLGYEVIGSDKAEHYFTEKKLNDNNIEILLFNKENIDTYIDCVFIVGHAYNANNNEEIKRLNELKKEYLYYSNFINSFFKQDKIGVSGTHGKTTISKMFSTFLPLSSYIIGDGSGKANKEDKYLIIEACEYKKHFLNYDYLYLIINNIDYDHPDYYKDKESYIKAFFEVSEKCKYLICNGDDANCNLIKHTNKFTYGFNRGNNCLIKILNENENGYKVLFKINKNKYIYDINYCGKHMLYNYASVILVLFLLKQDLNLDLNKFVLPRIRMEERNFNDNIIIDDYAHHPTEIKCTISAVKQKYPNKEIITIFQPHTYSRTLELKNEFKQIFSDVRESYLVKTFVSREKYDKAKEKEVKRVFKKCKYLTLDDIKKLKKYENKIIIILGAGDIHKDLYETFS